MEAKKAPNDFQRVQYLHSLKILDSLPEESFDGLVKSVANLLQFPIVLITLVDEHRQWFKAKVGLDICETSRDIAFCSHTILHDEPLIVDDATKDPRFSDNPLVTGEFHLRFYAGAPIILNDFRLGSICCVDFVPRTLTADQVKGLQGMADLVSRLFEYRNLARLLTDSELKFSTAIHSMYDGFVLQDHEGVIQLSNESAANILGLSKEQIAGRSSIDPRWKSVYEDGTPWPGELNPAIIALREGVEQSNQIMGIHKPNGELTWIKVNSVPLFTDESGIASSVVTTFSDITAQRKKEKVIADQLQQIQHYSKILEQQKTELLSANNQLLNLATIDGLTGVCNHRVFQERLDEACLSSARHNHPLSLLLFDIDNFKSLNDNFGHQVGDSVLKQFAEILVGASRKYELVARYGGEEFAILLPNTDYEEAKLAAERFRLIIENGPWTSRLVTASAGIATLRPLMNREDLIHEADIALYTSKRQGRNQVTHYADTEAVPSPRIA